VYSWFIHEFLQLFLWKCVFYPRTDPKSLAFYLKRQSGDWRSHFLLFFLLIGDSTSLISRIVPTFYLYPRELEVYPRVFSFYPRKCMFYPRTNYYMFFWTYKKGQPFSGCPSCLPGNVLLSQGQSPNYHRR
jgi:hypothetical protein